MIKVEVIEDFSLKNFNELKNIERKSGKDKEGKLFKHDVFECSETMYDYLAGNNPLNKTVVKVIELKPKTTADKEKKVLEKQNSTKKKKTSKK